MIERRCVEDVAFRVISANQTPDHATIARFRARVGSRGDELPVELADRRSRRARLERCKAELESEHAECEQTFREHMRDRERWEQKTGKKLAGRKPQPPARCLPVFGVVALCRRPIRQRQSRRHDEEPA